MPGRIAAGIAKAHANLAPADLRRMGSNPHANGASVPPAKKARLETPSTWMMRVGSASPETSPIINFT